MSSSSRHLWGFTEWGSDSEERASSRIQDSNGLGHVPVYESSEMEPYVWVSSEVEGPLWYVRYGTLGGFSGCEKIEERCSWRREDGAGIACNSWLRKSRFNNPRGKPGRS